VTSHEAGHRTVRGSASSWGRRSVCAGQQGRVGPLVSSQPWEQASCGPRCRPHPPGAPVSTAPPRGSSVDRTPPGFQKAVKTMLCSTSHNRDLCSEGGGCEAVQQGTGGQRGSSWGGAGNAPIKGRQGGRPGQHFAHGVERRISPGPSWQREGSKGIRSDRGTSSGRHVASGKPISASSAADRAGRGVVVGWARREWGQHGTACLPALCHPPTQAQPSG
jgi:hypothetical protein